MKNKNLKKRIPKKVQPKHPHPTDKLIKNNRYFDLVGIAIIILLGIIIYSNSFNCSFHFDDKLSITDNTSIRNLDMKTLWNHSHNRFIPYFTFTINYHLDKFNVWGYHLFNLIIHLINACLVWWLTLLIFSSPALKNHPIIKHKNSIAIITALLFVSHPLATQSVTYIVQRMASLAALFYFLSLALYMKARLSDNSNSSKYLLFAGSFVSAVMAMLSKENAFTLPFAIVLFEIFFLRTKKLSINFKDYRVILFITGFLCFILMVVLKFSFSIFKTTLPSPGNDYTTITSLNYLFTQFSVIVKYIQLLFLPVNQNLDHDFPISNNFFETRTIMSFLFLLSLIVLSIFLFKKNRIFSFGIFWFFLTLSIESGFIPISDLIFEHRTYLPSFGFFLILTSGIYILFWNKYKYIAIFIFAILIGSNSFLTFQRNKVWKNDFTLWHDVISKSPNKGRGYGNLGVLHEKEKKFEEALKYYNKTIELDPNTPEGYNNSGNMLKAMNKIDEALENFSKAIAVSPDYYNAYNNRGTIYIAQKKYMEAINDLSKAIKLKPGLTEAYANRGVAKLNLGKTESACMDFKKAMELGFQPVADLYKQYCQ